MGMTDEEIIQRFKVENGDAVAKLGTHDNALKKLETTTKELKKHHESHGDALKKLGKEFIGVEHHHTSLRHSMRLLTEATGVNSQGFMALSHSMGMLGPAVGTALGLFIMFKEAMSEEAEAANRAKEKTEQLTEAVKKFREERKEKSETFEYGEAGVKALKEEVASRAVIDSLRERLREAETGTSKNFGVKSLGGQIMEQVGKAGGNFWELITGANGPESEEAKSALRMQIRQMEENQRASARERMRHQEAQEMLRPGTDKLQEAETHIAQHRGTRVEDYREKVEAQKELVARSEYLLKTATSEAEKEEYKTKLQEEQLKLIRDKQELSDKSFERMQKEDKLDGPGVFATGSEKAKFTAHQRYQVDLREAERYGFDLKTVTKNYNDEVKKIEMESQSEMDTQKAAIKAQQLRNDGDNFAAEKTMADAHYQEMRIKDYGNKEKLKLDEEQHAAEIQKITIAHNNEVASYTSNLKQESLRIKGDQYGSEREALEEWQRKELELHKDQAEQIKALHDQRADDINRRQKEERTQILGGYATEVTAATLGSGAAGVQRMLLEHQAKQREYARTGQGDYAAAENQAFQARISRMKLESDMELSSKNRVGFMDVAGGWESFASSLNQNPMQQMQLNEQKATNQILREIQQGFRQTQPELVN